MNMKAAIHIHNTNNGTLIKYAALPKNIVVILYTKSESLIMFSLATIIALIQINIHLRDRGDDMSINRVLRVVIIVGRTQHT